MTICYNCSEPIKEDNPQKYRTKWGEQYLCSPECRMEVMFPNKQ